jgi:hypothetical protein
MKPPPAQDANGSVSSESRDELHALRTTMLVLTIISVISCVLVPAGFLVASVIVTITFGGTPNEWQLAQADYHRAQAALSLVVITLITAVLAWAMGRKTLAFIWVGLFGTALILFGASQIAPSQDVPRWPDATVTVGTE